MLKKKDTKVILAESLIHLSKSMSIENISVTSIVKNCGAGRQTFYNHFSDKYDLINWIYASHANQIFDQYKGIEPWGEILGRTLAFMYENAKFYGNAISEEGQVSFLKYLYEYTKNFYMNYIKTYYSAELLTDELMFDIRFNSYGAVYTTREWLKNGMKEPPMILGARIANAMPEALKKYFEDRSAGL